MTLDFWIEEVIQDAFEEPGNRAWVDIETRKVEAPASWPYRLRWQPFMIAVAYQLDTDLMVNVYSGSEEDLIDWLRRLFEKHQPESVTYCGTREFDAMILEGCFTNARRAHNPTPGPWPHLPEGLVNWRNIRKTRILLLKKRHPDIASKDVPRAWRTNREVRQALVAWHCWKDVAEMILEDPAAGLMPDGSDSLEYDVYTEESQEFWLNAAEEESGV